jgi:hypothetical protein
VRSAVTRLPYFSLLRVHICLDIKKQNPTAQARATHEGVQVGISCQAVRQLPAQLLLQQGAPKPGLL